MTRGWSHDTNDVSELKLERGHAARSWEAGMAVRVATRSVGAVPAPEAVAAIAVVTSCSCCDMASAAVVRSWEAATTAWIVAMAASRPAGATLVVAEVTMMSVAVLRLPAGGVAMVETWARVDLGRIGYGGLDPSVARLNWWS
jgi:hypothetical protein